MLLLLLFLLHGKPLLDQLTLLSNSARCHSISFNNLHRALN